MRKERTKLKEKMNFAIKKEVSVITCGLCPFQAPSDLDLEIHIDFNHSEIFVSSNRTYPQYDNDIIEIVDHTYQHDRRAQPAQVALEQRNENMFAETAVNKNVFPKSTPGPASKKTRPIQIAQKILKPNTQDFISWQKSQNVVQANTRSSRAKSRSKMTRESKVSSSSNFNSCNPAAGRRSSAPRHSQTSIQTKVNDVQGIGSRGVKRRSSISDDVVNQVDIKKIKEEDDKSVIQASSFIQALGKPKTSFSPFFQMFVAFLHVC